MLNMWDHIEQEALKVPFYKYIGYDMWLRCFWKPWWFPWNVEMISAWNIVSTLPNADSSFSRTGTEQARRTIKAWGERWRWKGWWAEHIIHVWRIIWDNQYEGEFRNTWLIRLVASEWSPRKDINRTSKRVMDVDAKGPTKRKVSQETARKYDLKDRALCAGPPQALAHQTCQPWWHWASTKVSFRNPELAGILPHSAGKWISVWLSLCTQSRFLCCLFGCLLQRKGFFQPTRNGIV